MDRRALLNPARLLRLRVGLRLLGAWDAHRVIRATRDQPAVDHITRGSRRHSCLTRLAAHARRHWTGLPPTPRTGVPDKSYTRQDTGRSSMLGPCGRRVRAGCPSLRLARVGCSGMQRRSGPPQQPRSRAPPRRPTDVPRARTPPRRSTGLHTCQADPRSHSGVGVQVTLVDHHQQSHLRDYATWPPAKSPPPHAPRPRGEPMAHRAQRPWSPGAADLAA
jgi:hypothetical protein